MIKQKIMDWAKVKDLLVSNSKEEIEECIRILVKICDNIIKNPNTPKIRTLQKTNATISAKVLRIRGGLECLILMGFKEDTVSFTLPLNGSIVKLTGVKENLEKLRTTLHQKLPEQSVVEPRKPDRSITSNVDNKVIKQFVPPPLQNKFTNPFLTSIESRFHFCLVYNDTETIKHAKNLIPIWSLEMQAQQNIRNLQKEIKKGIISDLDVSVQDILILELLNWFKNEFFTWVDTPVCSFCSGTTKFAYMTTDPNLLVYTNRVEMHKCTSCEQFTPFPRYNDLNILLETRKGRCGEWATAFTLFCRAMGWEARFVEAIDGDHVWTEVFSVSQKRWLHCDPCEEVCDRPLMYESGWNKKITYVMAYSAEEVQDVTWRYTSHHQNVLKTRNKVSEEELINALLILRSDRQKNMSELRQLHLKKRILFELVELMTEKKPTENDGQGRTSGSNEWRLARSEVQTHTSFTWHISNNQSNSTTIRYTSVSDEYELLNGEEVVTSSKGWSSGAYSVENIFRKEEKDWKQVYLCRTEGSQEGHISWKFTLDDERVIDVVNFNIDHTVFHSGKVEIKIFVDNSQIPFPDGEQRFTTNLLSGKKNFTLMVKLFDGDGEHKWQHSQLFRQPTKDGPIINYPFTVQIKLKNV